MQQGTVKALFIAPYAGEAMQAVERVHAEAGRGLRGDRYYEARGSFSRWPGSHREVTLISMEGLEDMARQTGVVLPPEQSRRNILVEGVELNLLLKQTFTVGAVTMEGMRLCQPCKYLARLTALPDLVAALRDRGGLRVRILTGGEIRVGDVVGAVR